MNPLELPVGKNVGDRYEILRERGQGEVVCAAVDLETQQRVALKFWPAIDADDASLRERFVEAAQLATQLGNSARHVVKVQGFGFMPSHANANALYPFVAMEWLSGETLAQRLERDGRLPVPELRPLVQQMALGLQALHNAEVLHAALSPSAVFLAKEGRGAGAQTVVKLLACGFARVPRGPDVSEESVDRTVGFMSPEQARGDQTLSVQADLWSLAATVFAAVVGSPPFGNGSNQELTARILWKAAPTPSGVGGKTLANLDPWAARGLAREPSARFSSARELAQAFEAVAQDRNSGKFRMPLPFGLGGGDELFPGVSAWRAQIMSRTGKDRIWSRRTWMLLLGCLAVILGSGVLVTWVAARLGGSEVDPNSQRRP